MAFENAYLETNFFYTGNNVSVGEIDEYRWYKNSLIFLRKVKQSVGQPCMRPWMICDHELALWAMRCSCDFLMAYRATLLV